MPPGLRPRSCPDTFAALQNHSDPDCSTAAFPKPHPAQASPPSKPEDVARPPDGLLEDHAPVLQPAAARDEAVPAERAASHLQRHRIDVLGKYSLTVS